MSIGSRIGEDDANVQTVSGYDHNYILPGNAGEICYAAAVRDAESETYCGSVYRYAGCTVVYSERACRTRWKRWHYLWKFRWFML